MILLLTLVKILTIHKGLLSLVTLLGSMLFHEVVSNIPLSNDFWMVSIDPWSYLHQVTLPIKKHWTIEHHICVYYDSYSGTYKTFDQYVGLKKTVKMYNIGVKICRDSYEILRVIKELDTGASVKDILQTPKEAAIFYVNKELIFSILKLDIKNNLF